MFQHVLAAYGIDNKLVEVRAFGSGLINNTWLLQNGPQKYILQKINDTIFNHPENIAANIKNIGEYLIRHNPGYLYVQPEKTLDGHEFFHHREIGYFRLFPFIMNSHTIDVVNTSSQAYEASYQFGRFTSNLKNFPTEILRDTIPDFHNIKLRYKALHSSIKQGNTDRLKKCKHIIRFLLGQHKIVEVSESIKNSQAFRKRVTHHDTKISNVLFDQNEKGLCVIDLDTVMPGYYISDVGDMIRTYTSPIGEEGTDLDLIQIRDEYFKAIADGYLSTMADVLSPQEKNHFVFAGKFMVYMQALRFLSDYLMNDKYYGEKYEDQNYNRTLNQVTLLKRIIEKESHLNILVNQ